MERQIKYLTGAVTKMEQKGDLFEMILYDQNGVFFCKKGLGIKTGSAYKFGFKDTDEKDRFEIVSVEQQILAEPAFKQPGQQMVNLSVENYKELVSGKHIRIRAESLAAALKVCEETMKTDRPELYLKKAIELAKEVEPYFE